MPARSTSSTAKDEPVLTPPPPPDEEGFVTADEDDDFLFPKRTRTTATGPDDLRTKAETALSRYKLDSSSFVVENLVDANGAPYDENTETGKKAVNAYGSSLRNAVRRLDDGKWTIAWRTIPAARREAFAKRAGKSNATHAWQIQPAKIKTETTES